MQYGFWIKPNVTIHLHDYRIQRENSIIMLMNFSLDSHNKPSAR